MIIDNEIKESQKIIKEKVKENDKYKIYPEGFSKHKKYNRLKKTIINKLYPIINLKNENDNLTNSLNLNLNTEILYNTDSDDISENKEKEKEKKINNNLSLSSIPYTENENENISSNNNSNKFSSASATISENYKKNISKIKTVSFYSSTSHMYSKSSILRQSNKNMFFSDEYIYHTLKSNDNNLLKPPCAYSIQNIMNNNNNWVDSDFNSNIKEEYNEEISETSTDYELFKNLSLKKTDSIKGIYVEKKKKKKKSKYLNDSKKTKIKNNIGDTI